MKLQLSNPYKTFSFKSAKIQLILNSIYHLESNIYCIIKDGCCYKSIVSTCCTATLIPWHNHGRHRFSADITRIIQRRYNTPIGGVRANKAAPLVVVVCVVVDVRYTTVISYEDHWWFNTIIKLSQTATFVCLTAEMRRRETLQVSADYLLIPKTTLKFCCCNG